MDSSYQPWINTIDTSFMDRAACKGLAVDENGHATEMFFPPVGSSVQAAKEVCNGRKPTRDHHGIAPCPVRQECLEYSLQLPGPSHGVWGGKTERERRAIKRELQKAGATSVRITPQRRVYHGTDAGYEHHRRRGESPCQACKEAHSRAVYAWRIKANDNKTLPALASLLELVHAENARPPRAATGS